MRSRSTALFLFSACFFVVVFAGACEGPVKEIQIQLEAQEGFTQSGTATLRALGDRTEVVLKVSPGLEENDPQPVHLHIGTCGPNLGKIAHTLNSVVEGKSTTLLNAELATLLDTPYAINLHRSVPEIQQYSSCGNLPKE